MYECSLSGRIAIRVAARMGLFVDILLGVPSIVVGLFGYLAIVVTQQHYSAFAGAIALAIIMFPIIVRSADEVLRLVPGGFERGSARPRRAEMADRADDRYSRGRSRGF